MPIHRLKFRIFQNLNQIKKISSELASSSNLKTLRLQENCLSLQSFPTNILSSSNVSLISIEGNLFDMKDFGDLEGYSQYMDRYTATKKKLITERYCSVNAKIFTFGDYNIVFAVWLSELKNSVNATALKSPTR
ncbi:unnamed protein product [Allacma fusca]|uniref:Uncharacterized protein n=1 Tax=Allacma fusca TaxID=39272 RepID=A0A8J2KS31_9HEXA|nr:unnamed protein product [Allacma fusca]